MSKILKFNIFINNEKSHLTAFIFCFLKKKSGLSVENRKTFYDEYEQMRWEKFFSKDNDK